MLPESASQENTNIWKTLLTQVTAAGLIFAFGTKLTILTFAQAFGKLREASYVQYSSVKYPRQKISVIRIWTTLIPLFMYIYIKLCVDIFKRNAHVICTPPLNTSGRG